jgi:small subunit ribosomal protein S14
MATKRMLARNARIEKKITNVDRQATREALKKTIKKSDNPEEVWRSVIALQKRPLQESPSRFVRRCQCCGRPKAVYRHVKLCRICFRQFFHARFLPGFFKAS